MVDDDISIERLEEIYRYPLPENESFKSDCHRHIHILLDRINLQLAVIETLREI